MQDADVYLNDFATRCFRDMADKDYISARMSHRANLMPQFLWQSLQAIEKYIKGVLLYNRVPSNGMGHDLAKGMRLLARLPFQVSLSPVSAQFIEYLDTYGRFRYLETPWHTLGKELLVLDKTIWELRRYCRVLDYRILSIDGKIVKMLPLELKAIENSAQTYPQKFKITGGILEKIIDEKSNPARACGQSIFRIPNRIEA